MSKKQLRRDAGLEEIRRLRKERKIDLAKCLLALVAIAALLGGKAALEAFGIVEIGNMVVGGVVMMGSIGLAVFAGSASIHFTQTGRAIEGLRQSFGIAKSDLPR